MKFALNTFSATMIIAAMAAANKSRLGHKKQPKGTKPKPAGSGKKRRSYYYQKRKR